MGLLNHLFGNKKSIAKELAVDENKRIALWEDHLSNYNHREELVRPFSFGNADKTLEDFGDTLRKLKELEESISSELINIRDEEPLEEEILADLKKLKDPNASNQLSLVVIEETRKQAALLSLFQEIHDVLRAELHAIALAKKKINEEAEPSSIKPLLTRLFELVYQNEDRLYRAFEKEKPSYEEVIKITKAILLQEELKEELETDEEKFARQMIKQMALADDGSWHEYRELGRDIFFALASATGIEFIAAPDDMRVMDESDMDGLIVKMEDIIDDDSILHKIIKKLKPKYNDNKIKVVILAFRGAYEMGHFEDFVSEFFT